MDYRLFKSGFGRHTTLVGGVDAVDLLAFADPKTVATETRRFLKEAGANGRLIAASSSGEIDDSMPYENVMTYFETVWEHGVY
jgi:uroporphyrinogen-III decarboxylase